MGNPKANLRSSFLLKRQLLSSQRQKVAETQLAEFFFKKEGIVGSYASFRNEISTSKLNNLLATNKRLALPRVEGKGLKYYLVQSLTNDLQLSRWGIYEPAPEKCSMVPIEEIDHLLVPGIAFDKNHFRLGYGKGFYDRLLLQPIQFKTFGISYKECLSQTALPIFEHDKPVDTLVLF
ncbi:MAG: 5-formyltetrahydrofolate cyclo-ligase [Parachlamydiaceae bacterium]